MVLGWREAPTTAMERGRSRGSSGFGAVVTVVKDRCDEPSEWLHRIFRTRTLRWIQRPPEVPMRASTRLTLVGGLYASVIGYATVVVLVAILDAALGRSPFYTAALFGSAMFYGPVDPATLVVSPGPVLARSAAVGPVKIASSAPCATRDGVMARSAVTISG